MIRYVTRWALSTGIRKVHGAYSLGGKYFHGLARASAGRGTGLTVERDGVGLCGP